MSDTKWICPNCGAPNTTAHADDQAYMLVSCDLEDGGCGRTVILDTIAALTWRAVKALEPACSPAGAEEDEVPA